MHIMKKYWIYLAGCIALGAVAAFVACDDEDHTSKSTEFQRMEMSFNYAVSEDLLAVADILITYTDPAGVITTPTAPLDVLSWSKNFSSESLPAGFEVTVEVEMKEGITLDKSSYTLTQRWSEEFLEYRSDGKVHWRDKDADEVFTQTFTSNPDDPDALLQQITTAVGLMSRTYRYMVALDPDGTGYEVTDND